MQNSMHAKKLQCTTSLPTLYYGSRNVGGCCLNSIVDIYISRILTFVKHINEIADTKLILEDGSRTQKRPYFSS